VAPPRAFVSGKAIKVTFPTGESHLLVEVAIDCPDCGRQTLRLAGHHLRILKNLLAEWIETYPELVEPEGGIEELGRSVIQGMAPGRPENN
jgi:hypothetical protein